MDILKKISYDASKCQTENLGHISADGLIYFEDLLDEKSLQSSLVILEKDYDDAINTKGEIDERLFANADDNLLGTENLFGRTTSTCSTEWNFNSLASPARMTEVLLTHSLASLVNRNYVNTFRRTRATPVSTAMTIAKWFRDVIFPSASEPSLELEHFLSSCDRDLTIEVKHRANIILDAVIPTSSFEDRCISGSLQGANVIDYSWAKQRKMESLKLYYRVLEAVCKAESQLLKAKNLTSLLSNERFHRCMLACSAELALATYRAIIIMFPAVLEKIGLTAFDLGKVIECFIRNENTLPRELKRHLNSLEEHLLESLSWEKGSSLYNSLIIAKPALASEINRMGLLAEPMASLDAIAMHHNIPNGGLSPLSSQMSDSLPVADQNVDARSPKRLRSEYRSVLVERNSFTPPGKESFLNFNSLKVKLLPLQSSFASPRQPNPTVGGETCAETEIKVFFSKVLKLAAVRIRSLSERLGLSLQIVERVFCLIQQILYQCTTLFFNRHIDQLILCSFYGVAKVSQLSLTFKEIINNYRKQPQCKTQIFRSVFVYRPSGNQNARTGQDHVDIITFYNEIFIPSVKPLLLELVTAEVPIEDKNKADAMCQVPGTPKLSRFPKLPDMSPKKVSPAHNVYVSPLRQSKMDALLSPSSGSLYACIGESTHAYRSPSSDLHAINVRLNYPRGRRINGRLNFDFVSDSAVGSLGYQNGCSTSSAAAATSSSPVKHKEPDS